MLVFLFSDIEGSSTRWESRPQAMAEAVRRHDAVLAEALQAFGGRVFKTVGDAFCAVFDSPSSAVEAAVAVQRNLREQNWDAVGGLRVRIAVHAGNAIERGGDFFGPPLNRVARILSSGHGGQVLVSGAVADWASDNLPKGISLRALGTFHLKDLELPETIYQVAAAGLASRFNPLKTLDAIPNNLPTQSSEFIGRAAEIAQIGGFMRESRLVTIAGPGGVGKTRIALAAAVERLDEFPDGIFFVNLAPLVDPALVPGSVLAAVRAPSNGAHDLHEALVSHLKSRRALLLLDNCEHVIDEVAKLADAILTGCSHIALLATSREALHIGGERVYRLAPMPLDESVQLFVQRAGATAPGFTLSHESAAAVGSICARLDGIPLAIELAAARANVLSVQEIERRLSERFRLLTTGSRAAEQRQQTLRALIDWSYELLTAEERVAFARLGVFRGSFSLDAALAVCGGEEADEWAVIDLMTSMTEKSLVVVEIAESERRYYLLETIREYAVQKLRESGEEDSARERHARFFSGLIHKMQAEFDVVTPPDWPARVSPDLDNYRSALEWSFEKGTPAQAAQLAADLAPSFMRLLLLSEGAAWCVRAAQFSGRLSPEVEGPLNYALTTLHHNEGSYAAALSYAKRAVECYQDTGDARGSARSLSQLASLNARAGNYEEARDFARRAMEAARNVSDRRLAAAVMRRCAHALPPAEIETARQLFGDALSAARTLNDDRELVRVLEWWAESEAAALNFERAKTLALEAIPSADDEAILYLACNVAGYALALGDVAGAQSYIEQALSRAAQARHPIILPLALAYSAVSQSGSGVDAAARTFGYANSRLTALGWSGVTSESKALQAVEELVRARAGEEAFERWSAEGARMTEEEALRSAQGVTA